MDLSKFTIIGEQERISVLRQQNSRLINLRWLYISLLPVIAVVSNLLAGHPGEALRFAIIGCGGLAINGLFYAANRYLRGNFSRAQVLIILQLLLDISIATFVIYEQGGLEARTPILFAIPIVAAGLILKSSIVYLAAAMSSVGYVSSIFYSTLSHDMHLYASEVLVPIVFYPALFFVLARLVIYLTKVSTEDTRQQSYDAFLALLSHQLVHPVSTVNAVIDMLEHSQLDPKHKKYVAMLKSENQSLLQLLGNLLETATPSAPISHDEQVDMPRLLQRVSYLCAENHSRTPDLRLKLTDMSLEVTGNSEKLSMALINILNNAFQYSPNGSLVTVSLQKTGSSATITISDKGKGVGKLTRQQLFKKYSSEGFEEHGIQGLGLGMFVTRKVVAAHGGSIHVVSDKSGTKVIIILKRGDPNE